MIKDLVNVTIEEIKATAKSSVTLDNMIVMYLQNNGDRTQSLNSQDMDAWFGENIDD